MSIVLGGEKGGIGKTTAAVNLAMIRARMKRDILLFDTDTQASAGAWSSIRDELQHQPRIAWVQKFGRQVAREILDQAGRFDDVIVDTGGRESGEQPEPQPRPASDAPPPPANADHPVPLDDGEVQVRVRLRGPAPWAAADDRRRVRNMNIRLTEAELIKLQWLSRMLPNESMSTICQQALRDALDRRIASFSPMIDSAPCARARRGAVPPFQRVCQPPSRRIAHGAGPDRARYPLGRSRTVWP